MGWPMSWGTGDNIVGGQSTGETFLGRLDPPFVTPLLQNAQVAPRCRLPGERGEAGHRGGRGGEGGDTSQTYL
jgi:hypothetical protein